MRCLNQEYRKGYVDFAWQSLREVLVASAFELVLGFGCVYMGVSENRDPNMVP